MICRLKNPCHAHNAINGKRHCNVKLHVLCNIFYTEMIVFFPISQNSTDTHQRNPLRITYFSCTKKSQNPAICASSVVNDLFPVPALLITFKLYMGRKPGLAIKLYVVFSICQINSVWKLIFG